MQKFLTNFGTTLLLLSAITLGSSIGSFAPTTAARNAPLMLGLTTAAFPDQPLIYAALVIGMLVEFSHLTALKHLLLRKKGGSASPPSTVSTSPIRNPQPEFLS